MLLHAAAILSGGLALLTGALCASADMYDRMQYHKDALHTALVLYTPGVAPQNSPRSDLYRTYSLIGRRRRKCDLCLDHCNDPSIARIHAVLKLVNGSFYISPYRSGLIPSRHDYPEVLVNGIPAPPEGMQLYYGDIVRLGNTEFYLVNTWEV